MKKTYIPEHSLPITEEALLYYKDADSLIVYKNEYGEGTWNADSEFSLCAHCNSNKAYLISNDSFRHITGGSDLNKYLCTNCNTVTEVFYELW